MTYCLNHDGTLNWQFPAVGEGAKGAFKTTPVAVDLNSYPDGGYETVAMSEDGHIYCLDTVGAVDNTDWVDDYYSDSTSAKYPSYRASPAVADIDEDKEVDIIFGPNTYNKEDDTDYDCYPNAIKWGMFGAGTKHDGNGDNRFAILIQGSGGDNDFEKSQFEGHIQEMGLLLTEHPKNIKPGPGYTGYYLQDHIYYVGVHGGYPYLDKDKQVTGAMGKQNILWAIQEVAKKCDSYDKVMLFYTAHGKYDWKPGDPHTYYKRVYLFDANNDHLYSTTKDIDPDTLDSHLDTIECKDMVIILQPCYSGDWIYPLKKDGTKDEKNRIILTSEIATSPSAQTKVSIFDKCNYYIGDLNKRCVKLDNGEEDGEKFYSYPQSVYKYVASDNANNINDGVYEINKDDENYDTIIDFYENQDDVGAEFVSGLIEAYYIDRNYYYFDVYQQLQFHESNDNIDADENEDPEITVGNSNDYVSCKEAFYFMRNWHLGYRLGSGKIGAPSPGSTNTWYDNPQIQYTLLEQGSVYLF